MSDLSELYRAEPHPVSGHRSPHEIAEDEIGPIGSVWPRLRRSVCFDDGQLRKLVKPPQQAGIENSESRRQPLS